MFIALLPEIPHSTKDTRRNQGSNGKRAPAKERSDGAGEVMILPGRVETKGARSEATERDLTVDEHET